MRVVGFLFFAAWGLLAQDITREGSEWVRRQQGSEAVPARATRIEVTAQGSIVLRDSPDNRLTYAFTQRIPVGARNEAQAKQILGGGQLVLATPNGVVVFFAEGSSGNVTTVLELNVPRHFNSASLVVQFGGNISVYDFGGNVTAQTLSGLIQGGRIQGSVNLRTGGGDIRLGAVGGSVECITNAGSISIDSAGGFVNCRTGGGQTTVKQATGQVVLQAEGGDISVERAASSVDARSASGRIDVGQAGGKVTAMTRGGLIQVGFAPGVHAESAQGRIRVHGVSGPLSLSATMGILAELLTGVQIQESSFSSRSGDITVSMPSNLAVSVMATEDSGGNPRIQSDFPEFRANALGWQRPVVVQGTINGGGPLLHLSSPVIYLKKSK
jgi:hypothetical protein